MKGMRGNPGLKGCLLEKEPPAGLPADHNAAVMRVKEIFEREVRDRRAKRESWRSLKKGQRYVRRELQVLFAEVDDGEVRERINALESAFGGPLIGSVERKLNQLQRQGVNGKELLRMLEELYYRYRLYEASSRRDTSREGYNTPRIVCSEALT